MMFENTSPKFEKEGQILPLIENQPYSQLHMVKQEPTVIDETFNPSSTIKDRKNHFF